MPPPVDNLSVVEWLWNADRALFRTINGAWRSDAADTFFRGSTYLGLDQLLVPFLIVLVLVPSLRRTGWVAFIAYASAGIVGQVIKRTVLRSRPSVFPDAIVAPDERIFANSFPSGHATIAFAIAFALLLAWPGKRRLWVGGTALVVALLVGLSRVYRGIHWPTDIVAGLLLGLLAALLADLVVPKRLEPAPEVE
jgi:undecaprenyl-diphosphatase